MREGFLRELAAAGLPRAPEDRARITEGDLSPLPEPVRRYLSFMRVVGKSRDWSVLVAMSGRFRLAPDRPFMPCRAWQYDTRLGLARIFQIRMRFWNLLPVVARDTYLEGRGRMQAKLLDLVTVEDASGPELDTGELVTYLNDAILFAPSMILGPETRWNQADDNAFDVALTDRGRTVKARVTVDRDGRPLNFSTTDRFVRDPHDAEHPLIRARWTTPIKSWEVIADRPVFSSGQAIWHLDRGEFAYADLSLVPGTLAFNVDPGA
jgi:hypothetical protein